MNKTLTIPQSWEDVTLSEFMQIQAIKASLDMEEEGFEHRYWVHVLSILSGEPFQEIMKQPIIRTAQMGGVLSWLNEIPTYEMESFELEGDTYLIPKIDETSTEEWLDFHSCMKWYEDPTEEDTILVGMAIYCRKKGEKCIGADEIKERVELFKGLSMPVFFSLVPSLELGLNLLEESSLAYSSHLAAYNYLTYERKTSDGIPLSMILLSEEISLITQSQAQESGKP